MKRRHRPVVADRCLALFLAWWSGAGLMGALYGPVNREWERGIYWFAFVFFAAFAVGITVSLWRRVDRPYVNDQEAVGG